MLNMLHVWCDMFVRLIMANGKTDMDRERETERELEREAETET